MIGVLIAAFCKIHYWVSRDTACNWIFKLIHSYNYTPYHTLGTPPNKQARRYKGSYDPSTEAREVGSTCTLSIMHTIFTHWFSTCVMYPETLAGRDQTSDAISMDIHPHSGLPCNEQVRGYHENYNYRRVPSYQAPIMDQVPTPLFWLKLIVHVFSADPPAARLNLLGKLCLSVEPIKVKELAFISLRLRWAIWWTSHWLETCRYIIRARKTYSIEQKISSIWPPSAARCALGLWLLLPLLLQEWTLKSEGESWVLVLSVPSRFQVTWRWGQQPTAGWPEMNGYGAHIYGKHDH